MARRDEARIRAADVLTREVALLFFRMRRAAQQYVGRGSHSAGHRSVLKSIAEHGAQGIAEMARERSVSRQHIQRLVAELRDDGLVRTRVEPEDRRTKRVELSAVGERYLEDLQRREARLLEHLTRSLEQEDLDRTIDVVRTLRRELESEEWTEAVKASKGTSARQR